MNVFEFTVPEESAGERLDRFAVSCLDEISRTYIQKLIKNGNVIVGGKTVKPGMRLDSGTVITVKIPSPVTMEIVPEKIPLDIIYQDTDIAVINKQQGLVVHPGAGNAEGTLVNALLYHLKDLSGIGGVERPGIVHRLDRDTSGVLVIAKNDRAHEILAGQFAERSVEKRYTAFVYGNLKESGEIEKPVGRHRIYRQKMCVTPGGRYARTSFSLVRRWYDSGELDVRIYTGRTHQIRVHLSSEGMPVIGDPLYSKKNIFAGLPLMLHSRVLVIRHPSGELMRFDAPLPPHMREFKAQRENDKK